MNSDTENYARRGQLIEAAKEEFLEKGYNKASLRSICAKANMTTGALYFFFKNKEDLFDEIVSKPLEELKAILAEHFEEDKEFMTKITDISEGDIDHSDISDKIVDHIYSNYDSFLLLLSGSENTVFENCVDEFVDLTEKSFIQMMDESLKRMPGCEIDRYMSHWLAHITVDAFIHEIKHDKNVETARVRLRNIMNYLVHGWVTLTIVKK